MDIEKQREIVRLWNRMRRVEGPIAEEIRIQILACFAEEDGEGHKLPLHSVRRSSAAVHAPA
jgi:hypothetical protein